MRRFVCSALLAFTAASALATTPIDLARKADELFAGFAEPGAPGAALIVLADGKPVVEKAWGHASIEHGVPFTRDTVVRLPYSETREFLASAAVLMERDGLVKLDAPVRESFPELPAWSATVTAWDLLNHRSGFVDEWATLLLMHDSMANRFTEEQFLQLLARQPRPEVPPGEGYLYSNSDLGLLKLLLQKAAGKPLRDWMRERLFAPLGMTATRLDDDPSVLVPHRASSYRNSEHGYRLAAPDKSSPGGNYFIASSAADLAKWALALADPGSDAAWANARLRERVRTIPPKKEKHYLFAQTELEIAGEPVVLHQGVNGVTWLARAPARKLAIVATTNRWSVASEVRALMETALGVAAAADPRPVFETTPVPMTAEALRRYAGDYEWMPEERWQSERPVRGRRARVTVEADGLRFDADGTTDRPQPVGEGLFFARYGDLGLQFRFEPLPDGGMALTIEYDAGYPAEHLRRDATPRWQPTPQDLARFAGRYRSDFLDYVWTVSPGDAPGTLRLRRPTAADAVLEPDGADTFRFRLQDGYGGFDAWVRFHRGADGRPTHLTVGYPRLVDHRFDRLPATAPARPVARPADASEAKSAADRPAEDAPLASLVGRWTTRGDEQTFREVCEWSSSGRQVVCNAERRRADGTLARSLSILSYVPDQGYVHVGFGSRGSFETLEGGTFRDGVLEFRSTARENGREVATRIQVGPHTDEGFPFVVATSTDGAAWVEVERIEYLRLDPAAPAALGPCPWPAASDALAAAPQHHEVLLENDNARVLEVEVAAGVRQPVHSHRWPSVVLAYGGPSEFADGHEGPAEHGGLSARPAAAASAGGCG